MWRKKGLVVSVILLLAFGFGLERQLSEDNLNYMDQVVGIYSGQTSVTYQGLPIGRRITFHTDDLKLLKDNIPLVELISPSFGKSSTRVRYGKKMTTTYQEGVSPDFGVMRRMFPQRGRFINEQDVRERKRVVFLGDEIAEELFCDEEPIGKVVEIDNVPYQVVGVMKPKVQTSMSNGPDSRRVITPYTTFATVYGRDRLYSILIRPRDKTRSKELVKDVRRVLGRKYRFDPEDRYAVQVWDTIEMERIADKIFLGVNIFFGVVGSLTLIVAGVGIANILFVVVRERTREIGVKMAIGARKRHIIAQFLFESLFLTFGGGILGVALSLCVISAVHLIPADTGVLKYMGRPIFTPAVAYVTVAILMAISILSGVFPARQAVEVDPIEALRYE